MANTASAKKAVRKIARRTAVNKTRRTRVRTFIKKVEEAIAGGKKDEANAALKVAESELMRSVGKGVFDKNAASRKISRLSAGIKKIEA